MTRVLHESAVGSGAPELQALVRLLTGHAASVRAMVASLGTTAAEIGDLDPLLGALRKARDEAERCGAESLADDIDGQISQLDHADVHRWRAVREQWVSQVDGLTWRYAALAKQRYRTRRSSVLGQLPRESHARLRLDGVEVLLVIGETTIRDACVAALNSNGAIVSIVAQTHDAIVAARLSAPDVVVHHVGPDVAHANALRQALHADPLVAHVGIVALTSDAFFVSDTNDDGWDRSSQSVVFVRESCESIELVNAVHDCTRASLEFVDALGREHQVHARLGPIGLMRTLDWVGEFRPQCLIAIQDALSLVEIGMEFGEISYVTCTLHDGTVLENIEAIPRLAGMRDGWVVVEAPVVREPEVVAHDLTSALRAELDAVSGYVEILRAREDATLECQPAALIRARGAYATGLRSVVDQLGRGVSLSRTARLTGRAQSAVYHCALGLVYHGAVRSVVDQSGNNLLPWLRTHRPLPIEPVNEFSFREPDDTRTTVRGLSDWYLWGPQVNTRSEEEHKASNIRPMSRRARRLSSPGMRRRSRRRWSLPKFGPFPAWFVFSSIAIGVSFAMLTFAARNVGVDGFSVVPNAAKEVAPP